MCAYRLPDGGAKRLKDCGEDVFGLGALDKSDVEIQPCTGSELLKETPDDVVIETTYRLPREVNIRRDKRRLGHLERGARERLVSGQPCPA